MDCIDYTQMTVHLGAGNDDFKAGIVHGVPIAVYGEDGDDTVYGSSAGS